LSPQPVPYGLIYIIDNGTSWCWQSRTCIAARITGAIACSDNPITLTHPPWRLRPDRRDQAVNPESTMDAMKV